MPQQAVSIVDGFDNTAYPGDFCCTIYNHDAFTGTGKNFCMSDPTVDEWESFYMADYDWVNVSNSWWCGKQVQYNFCFNETDEVCYDNQGNMGAGNGRNTD